MDYTTKRKGVKVKGEPGEISICPKCGRKGLLYFYSDGSGHCIHKTKSTQRGIFISTHITDSCMIPI